jgi:hypothetical protein
MSKINFANKETFRQSGLAEKHKLTADNVNEIKQSVNWLYDNYNKNIGNSNLNIKDALRTLTFNVAFSILNDLLELFMEDGQFQVVETREGNKFVLNDAGFYVEGGSFDIRCNSVGFFGGGNTQYDNSMSPNKAPYIQGSGNGLRNDDTFGGYTLQQVVDALKKYGLLK